ncbi:hypothetical protein Tco_1334927 [Tanacetum coccineum]
MVSLLLSFSPAAVEAGIFKGYKIDHSTTLSHLFYADDGPGWVLWWKLNTLSVGGRLTLLKSVLGSTPIYNMSIFKVPKSVLNYMESLQIRRVGVLVFFALNRALLFQVGMELPSHDNFLLVYELYSFTIGLMGHVLSAAFNSTWAHHNRDLTPLKSKVSISFLIVRFVWEKRIKDISVADKMEFVLSPLLFVVHVRGGCIESQQLDQLSLLLDTVILSNMDDRWFWDLNGDGVFQVKDVRSMLDEASFLPI